MNLFRRAWPHFWKFLRYAWAVLFRAGVKYDETDAEQCAASFAYYAFFALFPLMVLLITIGTHFLGNQEAAAKKITEEITAQTIKKYIPVDAATSEIMVRTVDNVVASRGRAGFIAFLVLSWSALRFFQSLVRGVNRAWGTKEYSWWRLPIKNLFMAGILASALFLGIVLPAILNQVASVAKWWLGIDEVFVNNVFNLFLLVLPPLVLLYGFTMFFIFAPRRRTTLREVWWPAVFTTLGLDVLMRLFTLYTTRFADFQSLYGTFGSVIAVLLWIYLSGSIIIFGACLAAAQYEINMSLSDQSESEQAR
ncbi:MAG: YihY/virulence factor BrkB family protein [Verrucomicrobiota bacterium]|nr:YihY/virulence factor BrkB family protein [Verrucomicrobiota bacterium]